MKQYTRELPFTTLTLEISRAGEDYALLLYGGDRPHIGCTVLAVPRPSLTGDGSISCTTSVLNLVGHMDDLVCKPLAEEVCKKTGHTVVCSGGIHVEDATTRQLYDIRDAVRDWMDDIDF